MANSAKFEQSGLAWRLVLEDSDVQKLKQGAALAALIMNPEPAVSKAVAMAIGMIDLVNEIGGRRGVEITGVISTTNTVVTPKGKGPYGELVKTGKELSKLGEHWGGIVNGNIEKAGDWLKENDPGPAIGRALGTFHICLRRRWKSIDPRTYRLFSGRRWGRRRHLC